MNSVSVSEATPSPILWSWSLEWWSRRCSDRSKPCRPPPPTSSCKTRPEGSICSANVSRFVLPCHENLSSASTRCRPGGDVDHVVCDHLPGGGVSPDDQPRPRGHQHQEHPDR